MQLGRIVGTVSATIKHASLRGQRLALLQLLTTDEQPDGEPVVALDALGAAFGQRVIACNDGLEARSLTRSRTTPARWWIFGVCDQ